MRILKRLRETTRGDFVRAVALLAGGTAFAQAFGFAILPLLTRLYTPSDFEILAIFSAVVSVMTGIACLRLDAAVPLPANDRDAFGLLLIALGSASCFALATALAVWLAQSYFGQSEALLRSSYSWLIPFGVWLGATYSALQHWATRHRRFGQVARTRASQSLGGGGVQIVGGLTGASAFGLLLGQVINNGAGVVGLGLGAWRDRKCFRGQSFEFRRLWREYRSFPRVSTVETFANTAGAQLPIIIIGAVAIGPEAGFLLLAMKLLATPMTLIGKSVGQVYLSRAPQQARDGSLDQLTLSVLLGSLKTGVGLVIAFAMCAPQVVEWLFGASWVSVGKMIPWLAPWFALQFLASPISMVMHVQNRQRELLLLTVAGLLVRGGGVAIVASLNDQYMIAAFGISSAIFYFACLLIFSRAARVTVHQLGVILLRSAPALLVWILLGAAVREVLNYIN